MKGDFTVETTANKGLITGEFSTPGPTFNPLDRDEINHMCISPPGMKKRASVLIVFMAIREMANWREKAFRMRPKRFNPGVEMSLRLHELSPCKNNSNYRPKISSRFAQGGMKFNTRCYFIPGIEIFSCT